MSETCVVHKLGVMEYGAAWRLQAEMAEQVAMGQRPPTLLLLEHPHTYTFGRLGRAENLLWDEAELRRRGVTVHWVDRGGDVTYHGPGQLVGYPLLPLAPAGIDTTGGNGRNPGGKIPQADFVGYLRRLEATLITALSSLGIASYREEGMTGVWIKRQDINLKPPVAKIAAIGVKVDARGVSRHGFALNIETDMSYWQGIIPCGLSGYPAASLAEILDPLPAREAIQQAVLDAFAQIYHYRIKEEVL
jgi:lipoate-protein ligase B